MATAEARLENLFGALVLTLNDAVSDATTMVSGHSGALVGALTYLAQEPGITIEQLRGPLGRTQSATVRIVDKLVSAGLAERRPGRDGRSVAVHLTADGAAAARQVLKVRRQTVGTALRTLSARDRSALTGLVETMLAGVTVDVAHGERVCRMCDLAACPRRSCPVDIAALQHEAEIEASS